MPEINSNLSRREFLKLAGKTALASLVPIDKIITIANDRPTENSEKIKPNELSIAALKTSNERGENRLKYGLRILEQIEEILKNNTVDLIITSEYSFHLNYDDKEHEYKPRPLVLQRKGNIFVVDNINSNNAVRIVVENAQKLAKQYNTNIFLSSFYSPQHPNSNYAGWATMAPFIDNGGQIIGVKSKFLPPEGTFELVRGGKTLKILPMLCGEAWKKNDNNGNTTPPDWVKERSPYDLFIHSLRQGDLNYNILADYIQNNSKDLNQNSMDRIPQLKDTFNTYYGDYFKYLKPNALIITSDEGMAGCFTKDLSPVDKYYNHTDYILAKFDTSKISAPDKKG